MKLEGRRRKPVIEQSDSTKGKYKVKVDGAVVGAVNGGGPGVQIHHHERQYLHPQVEVRQQHLPQSGWALVSHPPAAAARPQARVDLDPAESASCRVDVQTDGGINRSPPQRPTPVADLLLLEIRKVSNNSRRSG